MAKMPAANDEYTTNSYEDVDDSSESLITPRKSQYEVTCERKFKDKYGYFPKPNDDAFLNYLIALEDDTVEEATVIASVSSVASVARRPPVAQRSEAAASTLTSSESGKKRQQVSMSLNYNKSMVTTVNKTTIIDGITFVKCGTPPNIFLLPADRDIFDVNSTVASVATVVVVDQEMQLEEPPLPPPPCLFTEEMDFEVCGLANASNGRSCSLHSVCGSSVRKNDVLRLVETIAFVDGADETAIKLVKIEDGMETCTVGFIPRMHCRANSISEHINKFCMVTELYKESRNTTKRFKDNTMLGACSAILFDSIPTNN
jgi:hypothetical protein